MRTVAEWARGGAGLLILVSWAGVWAQDLTLYTDRTDWESAAAGSLLTEDYETEPLGTFFTPHSTVTGFHLDAVIDPITLQFSDNGIINGTREIHFRDFGNLMQITFPAGAPVVAFGFDWSTAIEPWEFHLAGEVIPLPAEDAGFLGVIIPSGTASFLLTSPSFVQGGISLDDLTYRVGNDGFVRADCNADGVLDVADPIFFLNSVFFAGPPPLCSAACDANDDGDLDLADPIYQLSFFFVEGPPPPPPGACGFDPTLDGLGCELFPPCP